MINFSWKIKSQEWIFLWKFEIVFLAKCIYLWFQIGILRILWWQSSLCCYRNGWNVAFVLFFVYFQNVVKPNYLCFESVVGYLALLPRQNFLWFVSFSGSVTYVWYESFITLDCLWCWSVVFTLQEMVGYFFCLEDRALLCRNCDVSIHTANACVSGHQRFLLTGVRVGLEATERGASSSSVKSQSGEKTSDAKSSSISRNVTSMPQPSNFNEMLPSQMGGVEDFAPNKVSYGGGYTAGNISQWPMEEFLGLNEFSQYYNYMDGSSKVRF